MTCFICGKCVKNSYVFLHKNGMILDKKEIIWKKEKMVLNDGYLIHKKCYNIASHKYGNFSAKDINIKIEPNSGKNKFLGFDLGYLDGERIFIILHNKFAGSEKSLISINKKYFLSFKPWTLKFEKGIVYMVEGKVNLANGRCPEFKWDLKEGTTMAMKELNLPKFRINLILSTTKNGEYECYPKLGVYKFTFKKN